MKTDSFVLSRAWLVFVFLALAVLPVQTFADESDAWRSDRLGNIFLAEKDAVKIRHSIKADAVSWTVTDFWGRRVDSGGGRISDGKVVIKPRVSDVGYYLLAVAPDGKDAAVPLRYTSFAIVRPHASPDSAKSPFGVATHFAQGMNPELLPVLKQIGIESIRDEHYWAEVERTKGVFSFPAKSDAYMKASAEAGVRPLVVLSYGNEHYDHREGPSTLAGFEGFANYGGAVLDRYGEQMRWVEVWNEYNGSWAPPSARQNIDARSEFYTAMLKVTYERLKARRPDVQVLGGAAVLIPLPYFERLFKLGGLGYMDGLVIHPYRNNPEGVDREVAALNELVRKYNGGETKPIWVTETGYHGKEEHPWEKGRGMYEKGRAEAARYLVRQYTLLLKEGVAKIYWYLAADHAGFIGMGLLRHHEKEPSGMGRYAVAPAYVAYANLIHQLDGASFVRREAVRPYTRVHVYVFERGGEEVRVAWATQPSRIRLRAEAPLTVFNLMGTPSTREPAAGAGNVVTLEVGEDPVFIRGKVGSVEEVDTGVRVLASTADDYSKVQGENNWRYGYRDSTGAFTELIQRETMWGYEWATDVPGLSYLRIAPGDLHPDTNDNGDAAATLRWESPVAGEVIVSGWIASGEESPKGDGVILRVFANGHEIFSRVVEGNREEPATFSLPVNVERGSQIDFAVSSRANELYDAVRYEFTVTQRVGE